jgi:outer membrane protein
VNVRFRRYRGVAIAALAWLVLLGWTAPALAAQAGVRIGIVDMQEVLMKSQKGQAVKQKLDLERAARQKELDARQEEMVKLQADFEKQAPLLSEQAKREKADAIQRRRRDALRIAEDANRDFEKRVREAEMDITREIFGVIQEYGKDQGYTMILERGMVVFGAPAVDITADIVKRYDTKQK